MTTKRQPSAPRILAAGLVTAFVDALFAFGLQVAYSGEFDRRYRQTTWLVETR